MKILRRIMRPHRAVEDYTEKTFRAISDGTFTAVEAYSLAQYANSIALSVGERQECHRDAIQRYATALISDSDGLTPTDEAHISAMMAELGIRSISEIPGLVQDIRAARQTAAIMAGNLPTLDKARLPMPVKPSDVAHFCFPVYTNKSIRRRSNGQTWIESGVDKRGFIVLAKTGLYLDLKPGNLIYKLWKDVEVVFSAIYLKGRTNPIELDSDHIETFEYLDLVSDFYGERAYFND